MFWDCLSIQPTWIVFFFQVSVGSDPDLNENYKDPYQQSLQENEIDICEEILKDVDNILPADTSVQPDLNHNPINQSIFLAGISVQPDLNPNPINQGVADVSNDNSIGTLSNNLPLHESTNVLENGLKKKLARTQVEKSESNAKKYPVLNCVKNNATKRVLPTFPVMIDP